ncbi:long-chain-fatty-acid--CoA ligase [Actinospica robiniae]|uniref:long-chain-fatty-acid--CoA ligase n=1 Tax=Actinospica robiniae TaxID=304901 RepID=UPI0003FEF2F7|nr:long-chain fatty acid--CoA ligase [Actinospica robiniae]
MNLSDLLTRAAAEHGASPALLLGDRVLTYGQLNSLAGRVAAALTERGVAPGHRIGLMLPNVLEFPVLYYGALRAGAVVVPMNPLLKPREIAHYAGDSGMKVLFAFESAETSARAGVDGVETRVIPVAPGSLEALLADHPDEAPNVPRRADDLAVILYTSGTTGKPKGAMLTHANMTGSAETARALVHLSGQDAVLGVLPLFHVFGQTCVMNAALLAGARLVLLARFHADAVLQTIQDERVSVFMGVPTMFAALLSALRNGSAPIEPTPLRACVSGGASLPVEILHAFEAAFDCLVLEGYGMSETTAVASFNRTDRARKPGSVGIPVGGVEMRLIDVSDGVGEICVRGHTVMAGYWSLPETTAETLTDGWLRTGDLARIDEDGYYYIVDRKKDMIIRGGYNVYPREIEEVLYEHPDVVEAAVVGIAHPELGEEVAAAVVLRAGACASEAELRQFVRDRVAPYKYPREIWLRESLPKGPTGKILKREINSSGKEMADRV